MTQRSGQRSSSRLRLRARHGKRRHPQQLQGSRRSSTEGLSCVTYDNSCKPGREASGNDAGADDDWSVLPPHALDLVLDRLPARQRCRMRTVCSAWNSLLPLSQPSQELWFVMVRPSPPDSIQEKWRFRAFSSCSLEEDGLEGQNCFFRPPFPNPHHSKLSSFLGGRYCSGVARRLKGSEPPFFLDLLLHSAGGLMSAMVCRLDAKDSYDFIVFNCLTGCVKVLPPPLNGKKLWLEGSFMLGHLSMTHDGQNPGSYYILLIQDPRIPVYFEIFESKSACWKAVYNPFLPFQSGQLLRNFVSTHSSSVRSVVDADFWWWEVSSDSDQYCLLAYHARYDAWTSLLLPLDPCENVVTGVVEPCFAKYERRLLLGLPLVGMDGAILGFGVWQLKLTSMEAGTWVEVARTPEYLCPSLDPKAWSCELFADGGLFWMTFGKLRNYRSFRPPLVFDMAQNSWYSLPWTRSSRKYGCIFVHRPSFNIPL
ncbi:hypothetical protein L7F22_034601 [Adiantum nelumboides]|nr:hypothetical protein [Adiantum nelumboides]